MSIDPDLRFNHRVDVEADISYCRFCSTPTNKCSARVLNWNEFGLCFKSRKPLHPGQCIYIRTTRADEKGVGLRSASLAQVRWCDENQDQSEVDYTIGASYL